MFKVTFIYKMLHVLFILFIVTFIMKNVTTIFKIDIE